MNTLSDGDLPTLHSNHSVNNKNHHKANNASNLVTIPPIQNSGALPYQLRVLGIADQGAKSRVETQIRLELQLIDDHGKRPHQWSHIRLSTALLTQKRRSATTSTLTTMTPISPPSSRQKSIALKLGQPDQRQRQPLSMPEESMLYLDASVSCDSDMHRKVEMCRRCVLREWKRADRKKNGRKLDNDTAGDEVLMKKERQKILLFNSDPVLTFDQGECVLPTRITCYSRHHDERQGFRIKFTIHDYQGHLVAAGTSAPIMITDDHKNLSKLGDKRRRRKATKKSTKSPSSSPPLPAYLPTPEQETSPTFDESSVSLVSQTIRVHDISTTSGVVAIESLDMDNTTTTVDFKKYGASNLMDPSYLFDPTIFIPSSPPSLSSSVSSTADRGSNISSSPSPSQAFAMIYSPCQQQQQSVTIERMIPNQASVEGGAEITLLGSNFYEGMTWVFSDQPALMTTYWSSTTIVCTVPPAIHPGPVLVRCLDPILWPAPLPLVFNYTRSPSSLPSPSPSPSPPLSPSTPTWNNTVLASSSTWQQLLHVNNDHGALGLSSF